MYMKFNMISKDDLANYFNVDKLKGLTDSISNLSAIEALRNLKEDDVVVVEKKKKGGFFKKFLICTLVLAAVCGIAYALFKYFKPEYEDEFMDDIDDEFYDDDDELFDDDEEDVAPAPAKEEAKKDAK